MVLLLIALLPALEVVIRKFLRTGIYASAGYLKHLVIWITFLGGTITLWEKRHLALSVGVEQIPESYRNWIETFTSFISVSVTSALTWCAIFFVLYGFDPAQRIGFVPIRIAIMIMPIGFAIMTVRFITQTPAGWSGKLISAAGVIIGSIFAFESIFGIVEQVFPVFYSHQYLWLDGVRDSLTGVLVPLPRSITWIATVVLILAVLFGMPIFVILGGFALILFARSGGALPVIPNEAYTMLTGPAIPAIPLFTLAGFILSESKAGERLMRLFQSFINWLPGGLGIVSILLCTFFTAFTGGSGVTIVALGALLLYVLVKSKYQENFSIGLLTVSGIGSLFPPSLPIILYGVIAQINIKDMFIGGLLPGTLMIITLAILVISKAWKNRNDRVKFQPREAARSFKDAVWEILLPVVIIIGFFSGLTTIVETGAIAVIYVLIIEVIVHRDIKIRDLPAVFKKAVPLIGGVLIILAAAKGFSYYIVDAGIPMQLTDWIRAHINSKYVFLLLLNCALLITGCFMDIFSAIAVMVPLIKPLGDLFGIHPVHLGVIFLANLECGYLTPPVGLNLFLASFRFGVPLIKIYRYVFPFFIVMLVSVLVITYIPWISTVLLRVFQF